MSYIQSNTEVNPLPSQLIKLGMEKVKQDINVMDLGVVTSNGDDLYSSKNFSSKNIKLLRKKFYINENGNKVDMDQPILNNVPTRGVANVGDIVIVLYANSEIASVFGIRELKSQKFDHSINNAIAIGII